MIVSDNNNTEPSRDNVHEMLKGLVAGEVTPEAASAWAGPWVSEEAGDVTDEVVWEALDALYAADSATGPGQYIYGPTDFRSWLNDFESALAAEDLP